MIQEGFKGYDLILGLKVSCWAMFLYILSSFLVLLTSNR